MPNLRRINKSLRRKARVLVKGTKLLGKVLYQAGSKLANLKLEKNVYKHWEESTGKENVAAYLQLESKGFKPPQTLLGYFEIDPDVSGVGVLYSVFCVCIWCFLLACCITVLVTSIASSHPSYAHSPSPSSPHLYLNRLPPMCYVSTCIASSA
jgi:hypothetical protein